MHVLIDDKLWKHLSPSLRMRTCSRWKYGKNSTWPIHSEMQDPATISTHALKLRSGIYMQWATDHIMDAWLESMKLFNHGNCKIPRPLRRKCDRIKKFCEVGRSRVLILQAGKFERWCGVHWNMSPKGHLTPFQNGKWFENWVLESPAVKHTVQFSKEFQFEIYMKSAVRCRRRCELWKS